MSEQSGGNENNAGAGDSPVRKPVIFTLDDADPANGGGGGYVNPTSITGDAPAASVGTGNTGAKRRGRPPGSGKSKSTAAPQNTVKVKPPIDVDGLTAILGSIHLGLATLTKTPELELEDSEARKLADATKKVAEFYDIQASEKALAWTNMIMVAATLYGPRVAAIRLRVMMEAQERANTAKAEALAPGLAPNVHQFSGQGG